MAHGSPDPTANPYLALAAVLMAGLDGIEHKLEPGDAMDRNLYDLRPDEVEDLAAVSGSLPEALDALEADHEFLTRGDVMPSDLIEAYVEVKRRECDEVHRTPHPIENRRIDMNRPRPTIPVSARGPR